MLKFNRNRTNYDPLIFVVEDNKVYNKLICTYLKSNLFERIVSFETGEAALKAVKQNPDIVVLDYLLGSMNGIDFMKIVKTINNEIEILFLSEKDNLEIAIESMKYGAYDYIVKDEDALPKIIFRIKKILLKKSTVSGKRHNFNVLVFTVLVLVLFVILLVGIAYSYRLL